MTQRNVTVFADGEVDRSPCGSGHLGAARAPRRVRAICPAGPSCAICRSSARASSGRVVDEVSVAGRQAVVTEVTGSAYRTGESTFTLDPDDPLGEGFLLR